MYSAEDLLEAAQVIRSRLPALIEDADDAEKVGHQLSELIARSQKGEDLRNQIAGLLASRDRTREWMRLYLHNNSQRKRGDFEPLAGDPSVSAPRYVCPVSDCALPPWYRYSAAEPIPVCPEHNRPFELVPEP